MINKTLRTLIVVCPLGLLLLVGAISVPPLPTSPSDGWILTTSNNVPIWTQNGGNITNFSGGSFGAQTANTFFAGPGTAGPSVPTFRAIVDRDLLGRTVPFVTANGFPDGWVLGVSNNVSGWTQNGGALTNVAGIASGGTVNNYNFTNITVYDSITIQTNVTVNQNISVSGKATLTTIIVTNTTLFSTNAYPLSPGTTWDLSRKSQEIITNANFNITALAGLTNYLDNAGTLWVSNSGASSITVGFTVSGAIAIGPNTTNSLIVPSAKMAVYTVDAWGNKRICYVCQVSQ